MLDLLVLWSWEYDIEFNQLLAQACAAQTVCVAFVGEEAVAAVPQQLANGALRTRCVLDRAWDDETLSHVAAVGQYVPHIVNDYALARRAWNKPTLHYLLMQHGLRVPHMLILPSLLAQPVVPEVDICQLGGKFSVKGAHSGGSGVLSAKSSWREIVAARAQWPEDETIAQPWVEPMLFGERRAWFRLFYCLGQVMVCWADDQTHIQTPVTEDEVTCWQLQPLYDMMHEIATICGLNLFSTEIACDLHSHWVVVDYVNDPCDFRPKSTVYNGVPDEVLGQIAQRLAGWALAHKDPIDKHGATNPQKHTKQRADETI